MVWTTCYWKRQLPGFPELWLGLFMWIFPSSFINSAQWTQRGSIRVCVVCVMSSPKIMILSRAPKCYKPTSNLTIFVWWTFSCLPMSLLSSSISLHLFWFVLPEIERSIKLEKRCVNWHLYSYVEKWHIRANRGTQNLKTQVTFLVVSQHCLFSWCLAPNKMQGHFWHMFLTQFFKLFDMVPSVLLAMVASITTYFKESDWLLSNIHRSGNAATERKKCEKSIKNCFRNWCQKWPCILFGAN